MTVHRTALSGLPIVVAALALSGPALAEPALPRLPADGAVVGTLRPTFGWSPGSSGIPIARYEVLVETPTGIVKVADAPAGTLTATSAVDLPDDGSYRWFVRLVNGLGGVASTPVEERAVVAVATPPGAPTLVEGPTGAVAAAAFAWIGDRAASRWTVLGTDGAAVLSGESPQAGGRAAPAPLPDGTYVFRVTQRNSAGGEGPAASRTFTIDGTPPPAPSPTAGGAALGRTTPAFSWRSPDPGATATWRVRGVRGAVVDGPAETTSTTVTPAPLAPGAYLFEVRHADAAGNVGPWGSEPFSIIPRVGAPPLTRAAGGAAMPAAVSLLRRNTGRLDPPAGARIDSRRPVLSWHSGPAGVRLYNLQLFRATARGRLVKVGAAFPAAPRYRLPRGAALARGACYVWRVWPYRARGYTALPLGTSDFCVRAHDGA